MPSGGHVGQHQVVVGAAADELHAAGQQHVGQRLGVVDDLPGVLLELGLQGLAEADRLAGDDVHQRPALDAGKHRPVDVLGVCFLAQDHAAARAAERLVRGRGHVVGHRHRVVVQLGRHQAGVVGHVDQQLRPALAGDLGELAVRNLARIGAGPGHDHLRLVLAGQRGDLVEVDAVRVGPHAVADEVVELARDVQLHAVRQVSAVGQIEAQHGVARLQASRNRRPCWPGRRSAAGR